MIAPRAAWRWGIVVFWAFLWGLAAGSAHAEVYLGGEEADARESSLTRDPKPYLAPVGLHDLVTIRVKDIFQFKNNITSNQKKEYDLDFELSDWFNIRTKGGEFHAQPGRRIDSRGREEGSPLKLDLETEKEAKGIYGQSDQMQLVASLTAEVVDVKPNGTLVLEARKITVKDEDRQTIVFTGVARRQDIRADNTIDSERVANPTLRVEKEGPGASTSGRGWFAKILDTVWPF